MMQPTISSVFNRNQPMAIKPSSWLEKGIQLEKVSNINLFKITDELSDRMQELVDKKTADSQTPEEEAELEAIGELVIIVTYINGMIANEARESNEPGNKDMGIDRN
ncbi:hypothetical protein [Dendronalium sp. ChiSLP03b]|uniref:hypothetical protein n=1 Tax=Dendronalium sp. ChiSLP03b TaxID=3075381 RepID=UPI002AD3F886|nr:hypothetical protein [Dendronalium sp. ChiSLP03b]MDZ8207440.1 hypothetical protein [Dendronalium sp. ChiSLP03b]